MAVSNDVYLCIVPHESARDD